MARKSNKDNYCVYVHINKINGKMYVGQSCDLHERWRCQGKNYFNSIKFFHAIKKYGWNNFIHAVIKDSMFIDEADAVEKELIETFDTINNGYNLKGGGARGELSPESLKKMGESTSRGFREHPERLEKIRQAHLGMKMSEEAKERMRASSKRAIRITIDGEIGSIRYWAGRLGITHHSLLWQKSKYGLEIMIQYIRDRLPKAAQEKVWWRDELDECKRK